MRGLCLFAAFSLAALAQQEGLQPVEQGAVEYSDEGRLAGLEGTVRLSFVLGEDGSPRNLRVTQPLGLGMDEKALEAVKHWRFSPPAFGNSPPSFGSATWDTAVDFLLPSKQSRWHLTKVNFNLPKGASRPVFLEAKYPLGSGIALESGETAIDEARILAAVGRQAWAVVSFEVDESGLPGRFGVTSVSADVWKNQAVALVRNWRFKPGMRDGKPIVVPATLTLVWGERNTSISKLTQAIPGDPRPETPPTVSYPWFHAPESGTARVALPTNVQSQRLTKKVAPTPSPLSALSGGSTVVNISVLIGTDGRVLEALGLTGNPLLMGAAVEAIKQWEYRPTVLNGRPVEVVTMVEVEVPRP